MKTFFDLNFKLGVLNELLEDGKMESVFNDLERKAKTLQKEQKAKNRHVLHPELIQFIQDIDLTEEDLQEVYHLSFEGGNEIYQLVWPDWDGEDELFLVRDCRDVKWVPNVMDITDTTVCSITDASPLLLLEKLESLDISYGYGILDKVTIAKLKERGVEILSEEVESSTVDQAETAKENMRTDRFNHAYDLLWEDDKAEEALEIFNDLIAERPDDADCWLEKGNALDALGMPEEAGKSWEKCFELNPENSSVNYNLANVTLEKGDYRTALKHIDAAIKNGMDESPEAYHVKAQLLDFLNDKTNATKFFELALKLYQQVREEEGDDDETAFQLACVCNRLGRTDEALQQLRLSVKLDSSNKARARKDKDFKNLLKNDDFLKITK